VSSRVKIVRRTDDLHRRWRLDPAWLCCRRCSIPL